VVKLYEGMFIVRASAAKENLDAVQKELTELIGKGGGDVVSFVKWGERRLGYEIAGVKKGVYLLAHFNAPPEAIAKIERYAKISDTVVRLLVTIDEDGIEKEKEKEKAAAEAAPKAVSKAAPKAAPDAAPDAAPEAAPEAAPDVAPEAAPEPAPEAAPAAPPDDK